MRPSYFPVTLAILGVLFPAKILAQPQTEFDTSQVSKIKYTRLAHFQKDRANLLGGDRAEVAFSLIQISNLTTGQALRGVEVDVSKQETQAVGGSIGLAAIGSLFGASSSVTYRKIRNSGHILLRPSDVDTVVSFLNEVVGSLGRKQNQMKIWKVSLQQGFELGMLYDPTASVADSPRDRPGWKFIITADGATYRLTYRDGLDVIRTLSAWRDRLP